MAKSLPPKPASEPEAAASQWTVPGRYLSAVWEDGVARMGSGLGILSAFLAAYFAFFAGHSIALLWLLAVVSFVFAGYRVWVKEHRARMVAEHKMERPKLTGFFQDIQMHHYGDPCEKLSDDGTVMRIVLGPDNPTGSQFNIKLRIVNENQTPTTLHNFSLTVWFEGKDGHADHAEDWIVAVDKDGVWISPTIAEEIALEEKRYPNLVASLISGDREFVATQGKALEGSLIFRVPDFFLNFDGEDERPLGITVAVEDAWGVKHLIADRWGPKPRPLPQPFPQPKPLKW